MSILEKQKRILQQNKYLGLERGAYFIEYAILLSFAVLFLSFSDMRGLIYDVASNESNHPLINKDAYKTMPVLQHNNEQVTPEEKPDEYDPENPPNIDDEITFTSNLTSGYYHSVLGILSHKGNGNTYCLINSEDNRIYLDANSSYKIYVKNSDYKMVDNKGGYWELKNYSIELVVVYDYFDKVLFEYVYDTYPSTSMANINSQNIVLQTGGAPSYYLLYNITRNDKKSMNQGNEIKAVSYMIQQNLMIEKVQ